MGHANLFDFSIDKREQYVIFTLLSLLIQIWITKINSASFPSSFMLRKSE